LTAYDPSQWSDLFVATAGASAALAGLLFVAVSVNVDRIVRFEGLPERALEAVILLIGVLLVSVVGLIPDQGRIALGLELLALGWVMGSSLYRLPTTSEMMEVVRGWLLMRWTMRICAVAPLILAGLTVLAEAGGGLYWVAVGIVFAIVAAVANAWVLLVEILR